jgi:hypothetical protein
MKSYLICFISDGGGVHDRNVTSNLKLSVEDLTQLRDGFEKEIGEKVSFTNVVELRYSK